LVQWSSVRADLPPNEHLWLALLVLMFLPLLRDLQGLMPLALLTLTLWILLPLLLVLVSLCLLLNQGPFHRLPTLISKKRRLEDLGVEAEDNCQGMDSPTGEE